jgi:hypothetical protein
MTRSSTNQRRWARGWHKLTLTVLAVTGCATLQQIAALRQVDFALRGVRNGELAGVSLARVANYRDLTAVELGRIGYALARNELPLEFQLDIAGLNPPDNRTTATMVRLAWSVFLDDRETVSGVLDTNFVFPPGQEVVFPLAVSLNLRREPRQPRSGTRRDSRRSHANHGARHADHQHAAGAHNLSLADHDREPHHWWESAVVERRGPGGTAGRRPDRNRGA